MAAMKRMTTMITGPSMSVRRLSKPDKLKVFLKESKVSIFIFYVLFGLGTKSQLILEANF